MKPTMKPKIQFDAPPAGSTTSSPGVIGSSTVTSIWSLSSGTSISKGVSSGSVVVTGAAGCGVLGRTTGGFVRVTGGAVVGFGVAFGVAFGVGFGVGAS